MSKQFGRDEMNALLGGATEEMAAFRPSTVVPGRDSKKKSGSGEPDISKMTAAEIAALLLEKKKGGRSNNTTRYRTNRTLAHHELAKEISEENETANRKQESITQNIGFDEDGSGDDDGEFVASPRAKRQRVAPQIVHSKAEPKVLGRRKRRVYNSSSSDSDSESDRVKQRNRSRGSDDESSDSSDDEAHRRLRRQQASQKIEETKILIPKAQSDNAKRVQTKPEILSTGSRTMESRKETEQRDKKKRLHNSSSESSSEDDSSGSDSSSSETSSSDEDEPILAKPIFVPKSKRNLILSEEKKFEEEEARIKREKEREERRKMQSRALVAQQVANAGSSMLLDDSVDEEAGGATNSPPDDSDDVDIATEKDAWEIRELERLLVAMDKEKQRFVEVLEYQRRRQMTDDECMKEDMENGRYQAPGSMRTEEKPERGLQRFYHRGAYYMDEEEWDESDIRHKAAEYAKAATGEDKIDKTQLPEIMQVKRFGFARQNHRYKGLSKEDTTDKSMGILPLVHKKKGSH